MVLSSTANQLLTLAVGQATDLIPIFFSDIVVDFYYSRAEAVAAPSLAAGNPIMFSGLAIIIVRFKSPSRKRMKATSLVVQRLA
jgi:hypothetical protein